MMGIILHFNDKVVNNLERLTNLRLFLFLTVLTTEILLKKLYEMFFTCLDSVFYLRHE